MLTAALERWAPARCHTWATHAWQAINALRTPTATAIMFVLRPQSEAHVPTLASARWPTIAARREPARLDMPLGPSATWRQRHAFLLKSAVSLP